MAKELDKNDLRSVALFQKGVLLCILGYLMVVVVRLGLPEQFQFLLIPMGAGLAIVATIFVFMLALKLYSTAVGILLGLLTLIPCVGLIILLVINSKATGALNRAGFKVGLLGASLSQFDR